MGAIVVALAASAAAAQPALPIHGAWNPPVRQNLGVAGGLDEATDMATWYEAATNTTWVYVTGWMTGSAGGKVFATYRHDAANPTVGAIAAYYPFEPALEAREHKAAALVVDSNTGEVYVTGSSQKADGTTDFITIKYDSALVRSLTWPEVVPDLVGVRRYNGPANGSDRPTDIILYDDGVEKRAVVTGTSWGGANQDDILTVAYTATGGGVAWTDRYDGPGHGADLAAEVAAARIAGQSGGPVGVAVFVSGTSLGSATTGFDAVALRIDPDGSRSVHWPDLSGGQYGWGPGVRRYDGPTHGDEEVTGIAAVPLTNNNAHGIVVCGAVPRYPAYPGDTEWLLWSINPSNGAPWWPGFGWYGEGVRTHSGGGVSGARDIAHDALIHETSGLLWATGEVVESSGIDVGTATWEMASPGQMQHVSVFTFGDATDDVALRLALNSAQTTKAYVTGWMSDANTEGSLDYLTLAYQAGASPTLTVTHVGVLDGGHALEDRSRPIWWAPSLGDVLVSGRSHHPVLGGDDLTVRYITP